MDRKRMTPIESQQEFIDFLYRKIEKDYRYYLLSREEDDPLLSFDNFSRARLIMMERYRIPPEEDYVDNDRLRLIPIIHEMQQYIDLDNQREKERVEEAMRTAREARERLEEEKRREREFLEKTKQINEQNFD